MKTSLISAAVLAACCTWSAGAHAAYDYYLSIDGITNPDGVKIEPPMNAGSSDVKDWIAIDSWSWGATMPTSIGSGTSGAGAGKVSFSSFNWTQPIGPSTTQEFTDLAKGTHFKTVTLNVVQTGGKAASAEIFQMTFSTALLTSIQISAAGGLPMSSLSLQAGAVTMKYWSQNKDGSFGAPEVGGWDVTKNTYTGSPLALAGLAMVMPSAVPEPQTWALGLVALGAVGWARRRQV